MSNSEPMWYCHNCATDIRPLMIPDPHCPQCHDSFVERLDNPEDDPRNFQAGGLDDDMNLSGLLAHFSEVLRATTNDRGTARRAASPERPRNQAERARGSQSSPPRMFRLDMNGPTGHRTIVLSGVNTLGRQNGDAVATGMPGSFASSTRNPFSSGIGLGPSASADSESSPYNNHISGNLMANYLLALLGGGPFGVRENPLYGFPTGNPFGLHDGRMGDYVFSQEALDNLLTQMMENANSHRPVPASEELINNLPRETVEPNTPLLEKDCAVCKEQFSLTPEDPKDKTIVTLPCHHPFHENCILPWLRSSGTCPVCRYALIAQPHGNGEGSGPPGPSQHDDHNHRPPAPPSGGGGGSAPPSGGESRSSGSSTFNIFSNLFHSRGHGSHSSSGRPPESHSHIHRPRTERQQPQTMHPNLSVLRQSYAGRRRSERSTEPSAMRARRSADREQFGSTSNFFD